MGMQYTSTVLDRRTGELVSVDLGDFLTVTELGATLGLSPRKTRKVLHVLGLVEPEGGRGNYRLTRDAVNKGYGKRHDRPKHGKYPFDVLSPAGQKLVADGLDVALAQLEDRRVPKAQELRWSLEAYQAWRRAEKLSAMTLQMEVCWLADHFRMQHLRRSSLPPMVRRGWSGTISASAALIMNANALHPIRLLAAF
jgi:hypothetical protein